MSKVPPLVLWLEMWGARGEHIIKDVEKVLGSWVNIMGQITN